jgi:hypothetical protein
MLPRVIFTDIASLVSQLSFVADGMRIRISLSPRISALQTDDLFSGLFRAAGNALLSSIDGTTARLFGADDWAWVTVIVLVEVLTATEVAVDKMLGTEDRIDVAVEIGTADITLLLIDMAGVENR